MTMRVTTPLRRRYGAAQRTKKGSTMSLEDKQAEITDAVRAARSLLADLESAESCESDADFVANLENALESLAEIRKEIKELL